MFNKISHKEIVEFTRVFSLLLFARIPVVYALDLIYSQTKNEKLAEVIKQLIKDIRSGASLSTGFAKFPNIFTEIFIANIKVGEETGELAEVIGEYTVFLQKMQAIKGKILQAIRYPIVVLFVATSVVVFMLIFIIPTFESLFQSVHAQLPPLTEFLLILSRGFADNGGLLLMVVLVFGIILYLASKNKDIKMNVIDKFVVSAPFISKIYIMDLLTRFTLSMAVLLKSKVGLVESLKISKNISSNSLFKQHIDLLLKKTIKGEALSSNLKFSKLFDPTFTRLLAAGEESAELDKVFRQMSLYYGNEFDHYLENITSLLEPVLIIVVGGIVAVILIALYLPMFEIINHFGV